MIREIMDSMPLSFVLLITLVTVLVAIEIGYQTGRWRMQGKSFDSESLLSAMTGAHLALLAFIMAFSFNMAAEHYNARKQLILSEANAIGTAHLRAQLVEKKQGEKIARLVEDYAALRASDPRSPQKIEQAITRSEQIHDQIWQEVRSLAEQADPDVLDSLLIQSLNEVLDIHELRVAAGLRNRVPPSLWFSLFTLLVLSMAGIGYFSGVKGNRNPIASTGLALSFSIVMFLIADLDRPSSGLVRPDYSAMLSLDQRLQQ